MKEQSASKIWGKPVLLAFITLAGLLAALLGIGVWYWLSWALMATPLLVMLWKIYAPKNSRW